MDTYHLNAAQDNLTGEYRQVGYVKVGEVASRLMQIWMLGAIVFLMALLFSFLARSFGRLPAGFRLGALEIASGFVVFLGTIILQEWVHVLVLRLYGARPEFGLFRNKAIAYISLEGYGVRRNTLIVAALVPLILITGLALLGTWLFQGTPWVALFALIAVVNVGASISDLWVMAVLLRYPSAAWTVDDGDGMRVLMPME
ncbi:MAG: DUF3267 domain-containing protein [Bacteroidota bacterium]